jgi:hypothetical protein
VKRAGRSGILSPEAGAAVSLLRKRLLELGAGRITEPRPVVALLANCWQQFHGSTAQRMHAWKLGHMEDVRWDPPTLSFTVGRHGAMNMGSTRAELQHWLVDIDRRIPRCEHSPTIGRRCRAPKE